MSGSVMTDDELLIAISAGREIYLATKRKQSRKHYAKVCAEGLCARCGSHSDMGKYCSSCKAIRKVWFKDSRQRLKLKVFNAYGGAHCSCCGETELAFLSIDHVNGGGVQHLRGINFNIYDYLKNNNYPSGYRVLCHNCNHGRHINGGVCPHEEQVKKLWLL